MSAVLKSASGNPKVDALLNAPNVSGTAKYLVDRWKGTTALLRRYETEVAKAERHLAELRSQQLKCAGGVETLEAMLSEFELPSENGTVPPPPPSAIPIADLKKVREQRESEEGKDKEGEKTP
jgi:hypothetical protein